MPNGKAVELAVRQRVPVWPMINYSARARGNSAGPSVEGGSSGSGDHPVAPGKPVPSQGSTLAEKGEDDAVADEEELLLEGDLPPDRYLTHRPKMAKREACQRAKMCHRQCRRAPGESRAVRHNAEVFGDVITMDHIDSSGEGGASISGNTYALIVRDIATGWLDAYPAGSKCAEDVVQSLQHFAAATDKVGYVASDDAPEYRAACKILGFRRRTSTPGRPQTNGIAERSVREALEGTRAVMSQAGLPHKWWSKALRRYCFLYNITKASNGSPSPWEKRFGTSFAGPRMAFGSLVSYKPAVGDKANTSADKFATSSKEAVLVGYFMNPGGAWSKDYLVLDLETMRQNKDCKRIRARRCGEVFQKRGLPTFPMENVGAQRDLVPDVAPQRVPEVLMVEPTPLSAERIVTSSTPPPVAVKFESGAEKSEKLETYKAGQFVDKTVFDVSRVPTGYAYEEGRITRQNRRATSGRPEGMWPELWAMMTPKEKREAKAAMAPSDAASGIRNAAPVMPITQGKDKWPQREKLGDSFGENGWALVARPVKNKEAQSNKKAFDAMEKDWSSLRSLGAWNEKGVREWSDVRNEAKQKGVRINVGMVFGICVEKGHELPEGSPGRKFKGRVAFRGNDVRDESHFLATFQDLGSAPAGMASGKFRDFLGVLPDWRLEQADAVRAYTQALLKGYPPG